MKIVTLLLCLSLLAACAPTVHLMRNERTNYEPTELDKIQVYLDERSAPAKYEELGLIISHTHIGIPFFIGVDTLIAMVAAGIREGNQVRHPVFRDLMKKASSLGADAVIIKSYAKNQAILCITGVAIKLPK